MSLAGKTILVVGGTGYVGSAILKQCVALGAKAVGVSRRGTPSKPFKGSDKVKWVSGSALFPEKFADELAEADGVVHTVGTLIDSTVLDGKKPGEEGSYEQMNYETAKKVGDILNALQKDKKMVYISAAINLPFQPRYLAAKRAAEEYLNSLSNIRVTALRPAFIYSAEERPWSVPLRHMMDAEKVVFDILAGCTKNVPKVSQFLHNNLDPGHSVPLDAVALAAIHSALTKDYDGRALESKDIERVREAFQQNNFRV